jgi:nucleoside-diphosphate-sugar epimerase
MNSNIITVLGGNGYIGKRCIDALLKSRANLKVNCVCRSGKIDSSNYNFDKSRLTVIKGDCMNPDSFADVIRESTGIIHSIGVLLTNEPQKYDDFNRKTCVNVAKIANENKHPTNFVYISAERGLPFPLSLKYGGYIEAKRKCENELLNTYTYLNTVILRPGFVVDAKDRNWSVPLSYGVNLSNFIESNLLNKLGPIGEKLQLPAHGTPLDTIAHFAASGALGQLPGHQIYDNQYLLDSRNYKKI